MGKIYVSFILTKFSINVVTQQGFLAFISTSWYNRSSFNKCSRSYIWGFALCV